MPKNAFLGALALAFVTAAPVAAMPARYAPAPFPVASTAQVIANVRRVLASYYGAGEPLQRHTASGAVFNPLGLTCAHRTLPLGTRVLVKLGARSVVVTVNDRGPAAWTHREIDLSLGAARALGLTAMGVAPVEIAVVK